MQVLQSEFSADQDEDNWDGIHCYTGCGEALTAETIRGGLCDGCQRMLREFRRKWSKVRAARTPKRVFRVQIERVA